MTTADTPVVPDQPSTLDDLRDAIEVLFPGRSQDGPIDDAISLLTAYRLDLGESRHLIEISPDGWALRHPLVCRSDMLHCRIHLSVSTVMDDEQNAVPVGFHVVTLEDDGVSVTFTPYCEAEDSDGRG